MLSVFITRLTVSRFLEKSNQAKISLRAQIEYWEVAVNVWWLPRMIRVNQNSSSMVRICHESFVLWNVLCGCITNGKRKWWLTFQLFCFHRILINAIKNISIFVALNDSVFSCIHGVRYGNELVTLHFHRDLASNFIVILPRTYWTVITILGY